MAQARILVEDWPLVVIEWPADTSPAEVDAHFVEMHALLARRGGPFAVVIDGTLPSSFDALLRAKAARGVKALMRATMGRLCALSYVSPSTVVRGAITAIHWVVPSPAPMQIFEDREEAVAWASGFLPVRRSSGVVTRISASGRAELSSGSGESRRRA